ncbi:MULTISPECIES: GTPase [unclassified Pseudoalteromonas]|uniref:GTPase family protein n=1 Tax=unclassified Pseudoalteromonas TaxID=194690 RepID=UPI0009785538|nr:MULTISPECIES: GTPase [unclassified Pseudoalteromonas]MDN3488041.1 50S ribosome-binding GTPase [Pseudoalteromonas sp. APC 3694]
MYKNYRDTDFITGLNIIGINPLDIMVTGVTGAGKSTTLNSIFQKDIARVGKGVDPETMTLTSYMLNDYFRLWDTPGLGDGIEKDREHSKKIIELLYKDYHVGDNKHGFIDMVLVIIEGSNRDMGTNYKLLNEIIVPNFQKERIVVAINQADMAMKGRYWDYDNNKPMDKLKDFLESQAISIQNRVKEATGVSIIKPIFYSAEYGYNIDVLLDLLVDNMPNKKRQLVLN